ncbi:unnamed protein product [Periconia digitata]|uniref:1-alkyl-2-acetylglycerophosphocholine esterase n=1 Tax=Periconia digitata TaxID=1303443 RepID=A0A9W4UQJ3_9PLEO|nr:unnamed protein product [Periconia digitata]
MLLLFSLPALALSQGLSLPPPRGPYNVGSKELGLHHTTLNDPSAPNNIGDSLLVTIYYPTRDAAPLQKYMWDGLAAYYEDLYQIAPGSFGNTTANIAYNATPEACGLPTLLFGPAGAGPPSQLFFGLIADSVSMGHAVVTVDHPYEQPYVRFPNGTGIKGHGVEWIDNLPLAEEVHAYRLTDNSAVLDTLPALAAELNMPLNLTHYILFGHSLGGSVSVGQELIERNRTASANKTFMGGINFDGTIFAPADNNHTGIAMDARMPTLLTGSSMRLNGQELSWSRFLSAQSSWRKSIVLSGSVNHTDFSDLVFMRQANGISGGEGAITATRLLEISRTIVGDFIGLVTGSGEGILSGNEEVGESFPELHFTFNGTGEP